MEPIVIKYGKKEYIFSSDKIVEVTKKTIREINHDEIDEITYNPKFEIKDIFPILIAGGNGSYFNKAFVVYLKQGLDLHIKIQNEDFERIKYFFKMPIKLI